MKLNTWWDLSKASQALIAKAVPTKNTWTLIIKRHSNQEWIFSLPQFLTFNETLCGGTEHAIDYWYTEITGENPEVGDRLSMTVTTDRPDGFTTALTLKEECPQYASSHFYFDTISDYTIWLCPYLQVLFKSVPKTLWVTFKTV